MLHRYSTGGRYLDTLIERNVPDVRKAVRWNTPFYGIQGQGWFLAFHCFTKYGKVAFLNGASLRPVPPVDSRQQDVRHFHIHEEDESDEDVLVSWIEQVIGVARRGGFLVGPVG